MGADYQNLRGIKVLIAKLGLDTHWRGAITVAYILKNAGMDVLYVGNMMPDEIVEVIVDEDPHVVGLSSLGGAHITLGEEVVKLAKKRGVYDGRVYVIGGVIPPDDEKRLLEAGFDHVFGPSSTGQEIVEVIAGKLREKRIA